MDRQATLENREYEFAPCCRCPNCGSSRIFRNATVIYNPKQSEWEIANIRMECTCADCAYIGIG